MLTDSHALTDSGALTDSRVVYLFIYVSDLDVARDFYESKLGLRMIEEDQNCVKFDGGQVILALNRAADYGISLPKAQDNSADIVFLVDDLEAMRAALESRGVEFLPTDWYQPGGIVDFYDPDGHWLTLYQPGEEAMTWPSGDRIRSLLQVRQQRNGSLGTPETRSSPTDEADGAPDLRLDGSEIFYVFFFVRDPEEALTFLHDDLGLRDLEGGPCSQACSGDEEGVVKYDTGGMLLCTHHAEGTRAVSEVEVSEEIGELPELEEHTCPPRELDDERMKGVAPVFYVSDIEHVVQALAQKRAGFTYKLERSEIGAVASFEDPSGHLIFLYEPSAEALESPSGAKIQEILATRFPDAEVQARREALPATRFKVKQEDLTRGLPAC
jgi:catechol 2,3-dioxygenase-like lactoylglutathione lyase family enzyme